ncbi:DUF397 domain-containing protein [Streptomyces beihaiensis]|uniref:DUF397 domain-containing protein n=1 Tax=Streptomyces beihaiensis TaxID=2984495 RepID=A0ABT3U2H4_9ACTN|nr:DUF397 domain-containing protein [Streptomyces beihaiensis]MCX3062470.1 DUF397 domain-containing protein [Streptomyces beihaiensis]
MNIPEEAWFKSSYSDQTGGSCVEVANLWFKFSYSSDAGGNCVEVADLARTHAHIAVRDSKRPDGPVLALPPEAFAAFVGHVGRRRRP